MIEKINKFREYLDYIERHYLNVQKAWKLLNDNCQQKGFRWMHDDFVWHMIDSDVKNHDLSKLSEQEFTQYRQYFYPALGEEKNKELFLSAWEHHKENNPHHWQEWTKERYREEGSIIGCYNDAFLVMMLVDWIAMSYEFGDTAKNYYEKNKEDIKLPEWAIKLMYEIFECIYPQKQTNL